MRLRLTFVPVLLLAAGPVAAQGLGSACHASSSYDLTVQPGGLLFDRVSPAPDRVELRQGVLHTDGIRVSLDAGDQDRLVRFERQVRELLPRVRAIARRGVNLAMQAIREQARELNLSPQTRAELDRRLAAHAADLDRRIDTSQSTHDWQGDAAQRYADQIVDDLAPLVAGDLGQQALSAAMNGDLDAAARLRDEAADLATRLQPQIERRLQSLQPQVDALCPDIERLVALQRGVRAATGQPLQLLHVDRH